MADHSTLYVADKRLPTAVGWIERESDYLELVSTVEIHHVAVQGLRLRLTARRSMPDEAVTCQLEYHERRKLGGAFSRVDWKPIHRHPNKRIGPPVLWNVWFNGTHHHEFHINWAYAASRVRRGDLPIAIGIPNEPQNFDELLAFLAKELRIDGLGSIPRPPWQAVLPLSA
jgi:hypothetical protein